MNIVNSIKKMDLIKDFLEFTEKVLLYPKSTLPNEEDCIDDLSTLDKERVENLFMKIMQFKEMQQQVAENSDLTANLQRAYYSVWNEWKILRSRNYTLGKYYLLLEKQRIPQKYTLSEIEAVCAILKK